MYVCDYDGIKKKEIECDLSSHSESIIWSFILDKDVFGYVGFTMQIGRAILNHG